MWSNGARWRASLGLLLVPAVLSAATTLSPAHRLRRLSVHLRGFAPSPAEYLALEAASNRGDLETFFQRSTDTYLRSPQHVGKMVERAEALFRLATPDLPAETPVSEQQVVPSSLSGLDYLVQDIVTGNESWDRLLFTPSYRLRSSAPAGFQFQNPDTYFLRIVEPALSARPVGFFSLPVAPEDKRFAGAVTTARFFKRYGTTNINRNRGRAAAVFRIFLCDDMKAVVQGGSNEEQDLLNTAFPPPPPPDKFHQVPKAFSKADVHGSEASCRACHYKLDPLGRAFLTSGEVLSDEAAPGTLTYRRADGSLLEAPGRGLGDLTRSIAAQPEYTACQVTHFWKWFVRADRMPTDARLAELVNAFESRGRRVNDFIGYLVNQPEFYTDDGATIPNLRDVKSSLVRCDSCHQGLEDEPPPSFVSFPIGGTADDHRYWIQRIAKRLDLAHDGKKRTMPPVESAWQPSAAELYRLKAWVAGGARDEHGNGSVDGPWAQTLVAVSEPLVVRPSTEFQGTFRRYVSGLDVFRQWSSRFPNAKFEFGHPCGGQMTANRALLGDPSPASGEPIYRAPSAAFVRWYARCADQTIEKELTASLAKEPARFYGPSALETLTAIGQTALIESPKVTLWRELPQAVRDDVVLHLIRTFVGPSMVEGEALYRQRLSALADRSWAAWPLEKTLRNLLLAVATQDAFLSY